MRCRTWLAVAFLIFGTPTAAQDTPPLLVAQGSLQAAFAPWDDLEALVCEAITGAHKQVLMQAYLLTSKRVVSALVDAHRRGTDVRVLLDAEQLTRVTPSMALVLNAAGIPIWLETKYQNAHNKIIVIDAGRPDAIVVTGSFNFTWTAQHKNAENMLIARNNPTLAARYALNWERHRQDAIVYKP